LWTVIRHLELLHEWSAKVRFFIQDDDDDDDDDDNDNILQTL